MQAIGGQPEQIALAQYKFVAAKAHQQATGTQVKQLIRGLAMTAKQFQSVGRLGFKMNWIRHERQQA